MLLPEEANPVEHLTGSRAGSLESFPELGVLTLELFNSLGSHLAAPTRSLDCLHPGFGLQSATAKAGQLVAKMADELLKLVKCFHVRTIAVGFQVWSRVR